MKKQSAKTHVTIAFAFALSMAGAMMEAHAGISCGVAKSNLTNAEKQYSIVLSGMTNACKNVSGKDKINCVAGYYNKKVLPAAKRLGDAIRAEEAAC